MRTLASLIVLLWVTVTVTLAYTGVKLVPQLVILGLVAIAGGLQGIFWQKSWRRYLVAPVTVLLILAASLTSFVQLSLWLFPAVTSDGHPVMPIGQTFGGIAVGFLFCVLLAYLFFARLKPDPRIESFWIWGMTAVLGATFVVDLLL